MFLERRVGIDSREAKGIYAGAAGRVGIGVDPGPGFLEQLEFGRVDQGMGFGDIQSRRQDTMMERERRLDETGHPGGGHGVADLRGDGPEDPRSIRRMWEIRPQCSELRAIGGGDAESVAFDQSHRGGVDPCSTVSTADRAGMAASTGSGQPAPLAVAR